MMRITTDKQIVEQVENKLEYLSLKNLLKMFKGTEEKENFVNCFNAAYSKLIDSERKNIEF
jgi:glutamine phosphoribosylpyrophosphate amidotransferase